MFEEDEDKAPFILVLGVLAGVLALIAWWSQQDGDNLRQLQIQSAPAAEYVINVDDTSALLTGEVATDAVRQAAEERALEVFDTVDNQLTIAGVTALSATKTPSVTVLGSAERPTVDDVNGTYGDDVTLSNQLVVVPSAEETLTGLNDLFKLEPIQFASGSADIDPASEATLDGAIEFLNAAPKVDVEVQGHTDNEGDPDFNLQLSQDRADAVVSYLTNGGISASRLSALGFGEAQPVADNGTEEGRAENRRIEFSLSN